VVEAASKIREIILFQNSVKKQQEEEDAMSLDSDMEGSEDEEVRSSIFTFWYYVKEISKMISSVSDP